MHDTAAVKEAIASLLCIPPLLMMPLFITISCYERQLRKCAYTYHGYVTVLCQLGEMRKRKGQLIMIKERPTHERRFPRRLRTVHLHPLGTTIDATAECTRVID